MCSGILSGQGDVWWGVYSIAVEEGPHIGEFADEFKGIEASGLSQLDYNFAVYKMMALIAPQDVLEGYATYSIRFTSSTDASLLYYFGPLGMLVGKVLYAWVAVILINAIIKACLRSDLLSSVIYAMLFSFASRVFSMSEFYLIISTTALVCYVVLLALYCYRESFEKRLTAKNSSLLRNNEYN